MITKIIYYFLIALEWCSACVYVLTHRMTFRDIKIFDNHLSLLLNIAKFKRSFNRVLYIKRFVIKYYDQVIYFYVF